MASRWQPGARDLSALAPELDRQASGAWVQRISQPAPSVLIFHLYGAGRQMRLVIDTAPGRLAFGLLPDRARSPANPPEPPAFCMMLRKYLEGRRLQRAEAVPGDRIVLLFFGEQGAAGGGKDRPSSAHAMLSVELTGRTANAVLVVQGTVAGWIRQPGPGRGLALREPYTLPPPSTAPAQAPLSSAQARPASL
ncbi:MAG: NFACT family protein, partial [Bacillota bacterium]